ncbi:MAG: ATP-binding cassette domain-containing protein [SAR324 cluster bacterium]|nr:ATP-binding cassette domain-containing protein [SAR324 cluster bacterium]
MNCPAPVLQANNLGRQIESSWMWKGLSFSFYPGDRVGVVGPSGSGKTLLLRVISGLDDAQEGNLSFQGKALRHWQMPEYRSQVIFLPQRPALLEGTVEMNLQYVYRFSIYQDQTYQREQILHYLSLLGREADFLKRKDTELSGGESQIVAFLRALQLSPIVLLFDEPTASLDEDAAKNLETLVHSWQQQQSRSLYLWTTHDQAQLKRMTDQQIHIWKKAS